MALQIMERNTNKSFLQRWKYILSKNHLYIFETVVGNI